MRDVFHTSPQESAVGAGVVVIHCSDPRYQPHFQDFLANSLALDSYALIAVPGGVHFLIEGDSAPRFSWVGWSWVQFLRDVASAERVILIGHDDCRWYLQRRFALDPAHLAVRIEEDLRRVRTDLNQRFPQMHVELYFARLAADRAVIQLLS
ncbi:MAG: hypothetical protein M1453_02350 [Acidobacteria bacterium]|nr:hypothetical protein [Acidobacteriota bacterium]MCL5286825.1 hypothetical protein [Acidobacteriota bacterium]